MTEYTSSELAQQVVDLVALHLGTVDELRDWAAGTLTGGVNSTGGSTGTLGYYPFTDPSGFVRYIPSIARINALLTANGGVSGTDATWTIEATNAGAGNGYPRLLFRRDGALAGELGLRPNVDLVLKVADAVGAFRVEINGTQTFAATPAGIETRGVKFPATQIGSSDANTLDDYEEGTADFVIKDSAGNSATMTNSKGLYTKIGRTVTWSGTMSWSSIVALLSGSRLQLHGQPFPIASSPSGGVHRVVATFGSATSGSFNITRPEIAFGADPGELFFYFTKVSGNNVDGSFTKADLGSSGTMFGFTVTYQTN
ncbi:MAG: hypothetical protein INF91_10700 [Alphaproteobacteria bacterium]|nr:hypothetical protein [Alphaproteobacteria bacterium]